MGPGTVVLSGGQRIATHTLVWTAGVTPNSILRELSLPVDERGVIDLIGVTGYYTMMAMVINVAREPLPDGIAPPLPALERH